MWTTRNLFMRSCQVILRTKVEITKGTIRRINCSSIESDELGVLKLDGTGKFLRFEVCVAHR